MKMAVRKDLSVNYFAKDGTLYSAGTNVEVSVEHAVELGFITKQKAAALRKKATRKVVVDEDPIVEEDPDDDDG